MNNLQKDYRDLQEVANRHVRRHVTGLADWVLAQMMINGLADRITLWRVKLEDAGQREFSFLAYAESAGTSAKLVIRDLQSVKPHMLERTGRRLLDKIVRDFPPRPATVEKTVNPIPFVQSRD